MASKTENRYIYREKYEQFINELKEAKTLKTKQPVHYRRLKRYELVNINGTERLIAPVTKENQDNQLIRYYVWYEELFQVIHRLHLATKHGGRDKIVKQSKLIYKNVTREAVEVYLLVCETCQNKRQKSQI